jgi:dihydrofolate reductase
MYYGRWPLEMVGGTTFHFVTDGIKSALSQAKAAANGKDVRVGGGVSTIRQYLLAGQIDELHLALSPVLLGEGESLFAGINLSLLVLQRRQECSRRKRDPRPDRELSLVTAWVREMLIMPCACAQ